VRHLWPRAIALGLAVIVAALLLKAAHPLIVLAVFVAGFAVAYVRLRRSARPRGQADPGLLGLQRTTTDPFGILGYPLLLLPRTADPTIDEVVWGRWRAIDVHVFALTFDPPPVAGPPQPRTTFSCAMTGLGDDLRALVVEPRMFGAALSGSPGLEAFEVDDAAFVGAMRAWSADAAFARGVLDPSGREWVRSLEPRWGFEVAGRIAMVYGPRSEPDVTEILEVLRGLLARLPGQRETPRPPFEEPAPES
jgi:hypothetical protein